MFESFLVVWQVVCKYWMTWAVLLSSCFLHAFVFLDVTVFVLGYVMDDASIHGILFLFREEDFTKTMYPSLNGSGNAQPHQYPDQNKVNLVCDVMRVAMEHINPQKWALSYCG